MDPRTFDALTRCAAGTLSRRSLAGAVSGFVLAATIPPFGVVAKKGGKGGKNKKRCHKQAIGCAAAVDHYCQNTYPFEPFLNALCKAEYTYCCGFYLRCKEAKGDQCLRQQPPCCPNEDDVCCGAGSPVACCPENFPMCPPAGSPAICCPTAAPIVCPNGSCTRQGYTCCPNNSGSCPTGQVCCDNDRCCPGGATCVGADQCV